MCKITSLKHAVSELVHDGDTVALEGFTHLIPFAAGHELIRQRKKSLTLVRMTPDVIYDQLIGAGCVKKLIFSWGGNPGVGSLHRLRDAVEKQWPAVLEIEEHSHADLANAYVAGASNLPFAVMRGYAGGDLPKHNPTIRTIMCPFTGEQLAAVPAVRPDVTVIHAQKADRKGNVLLWGILGVQKEAILAATRSIVTVEEIVDDLEACPNACVLPSWVINAVCVVPQGAAPSYAHGYYSRDNVFYREWEGISRTRESFVAWIDKHIYGTKDFREYRASLVAAVGTAATDMVETIQVAPADTTEMMTIASARLLRDGQVCFVGIGLPSAAANLARLTHAPDVVLIYESGPIGTRPNVLPLSIGDGELALTADTVVSTPEIFRYWLQGGRIDIGFLGAAQIDRFANLNTTVIGSYEHPRTRLPGAGGAPEIASSAKEVFIIMRQSKRAFVDKVDFITSIGYGEGGDHRKRLGLPGGGPKHVVTDLCIFAPDPTTCELTVTHLLPGVTREHVQAATGWQVKFAEAVETIAAATELELTVLRDLQRRTKLAHGIVTGE